MKKCIPLLLILALILAGCGAPKKPAALPTAQTDENSQFGVDKNINMETIDQYLFREDVAYRDVRMLFDPADYAAIGGEADLTRTIEGFKIVPYPYLATLAHLPVEGAYNGECLFTVEWTAEGEVASAEANYRESMMILEELFPKDKAIFLMCGGGGYAQMTKELLVFLGWEETLLYNIGANWTYTGEHALELIVYPEYADEQNIYATWRADYAWIPFEKLHGLTGEGI